MLLLTWHGTLVCLRQSGGGLVHLPIDAIEADAVPLDLDIGHTPPEDTVRIKTVLGPLSLMAGQGARGVCLSRYGQLLCALPGGTDLAFDRSEIGMWETFLPTTAQELADLTELVSHLWIDRATRQVVRRREVRLLDGFRLEIAGAELDLELARPVRQGPPGAPATGFDIPFAETTMEIVMAGPRSSAILDTQPWPVRARRTAELMVLAAHRQIRAQEPEQDIFERDVAALMDRNGPAGLDRLLEQLLAETARRDEPDGDPGGGGPPQPDNEEDVLRGWALAQIAPWAPASVNPEEARTAFDDLNDTTSWAFVARIRAGLVSLDDKPDGIVPSELETGRVAHYVEFLQQVAARLPPDFTTTLCLSVDDVVIGAHDVPVFGFQKGLGERALLLPDVDILDYNFFADEEYQDTLDYASKTPTAIFAGSTSGGDITPDVARDLSMPRLRAAGFFNGHDRVVFRLPNIVQCYDGAESILEQLPFCGGPAISMEEQLQHRLLLSMDGNGATCARVAIALNSHSVLVKYNSPDSLYYFNGLQPWVHYVPVTDNEDVDTILAMQDANPQHFERIAENGRRFAQTYLTRDAAERYAAELLILYNGVFSEPHEEARPIPTLRRTSSQETTTLAHIQERGDMEFAPGDWTGEPGSGLAIEGFAIFFGADLPRANISYQVAREGGAPSLNARDGEFLGTRGQGEPLYGLRIMIDEAAAAEVEITLQARFTDGFDTGPRPAGDLCVSPGGATLEAFLLGVRRIGPPGEPPPGELPPGEPPPGEPPHEEPTPGPSRAPAIIAAFQTFGSARPPAGASLATPAAVDLANARLQPFKQQAGLNENFRFGLYDRRGAAPATTMPVIAVEIADDATVLHMDSASPDPWTLLSRALSLVTIMDAMLAYAPLAPCHFLAELGDAGTRPDSVSICSANPDSCLLPDPDFIATGGYQADRLLADTAALPWSDRRPVIFWRGLTTGQRRHIPPPDGTDTPDSFTWLPRLDLCHRAKNSLHASAFDFGITNLTQIDEPHLQSRIRNAQLTRPSADPAEFVRCKALLIIDGNSTPAPALFRALLSRACIIIVQSDQNYRHFLSNQLIPWTHYIPVLPDLSNLDTAVEWLLANDTAARTMGESSRALADTLTFENVVDDGARRLRTWIDSRRAAT